MSDQDPDSGISGGTPPPETRLSKRFARLREAEAQSAPPIPAPASIVPLRARPRLRMPALGALAAGVALVAVALTWFSDTPQDDPAELYASIMDAQQMQTDGLLLVSDGTLPAMTTVPSLYEIESQFDPDSFDN